MKRMCRLLIISTILLVSFNLVPQFCNAQVGDPGEDPDAPIDGGVSLLIAAGIGYGIKKAHDKRKQHKVLDVTEKNK